MQWQKDEYIITTDSSFLDFDVVFDFISNSYWAKNIPVQTLKKALDNALCFMLLHGEKQVGFARVVSDYATFAYLADVFVIEEQRGKGLSKWLMECVMAHPDTQGIRRFMLATRDAHSLYRQFGFDEVKNPEILMQIHRPDIYLKP